MTALPWYVARSAGLVAWALVTASVLWGLAISTKALGRRPRPAWLLDLHRHLAGLAVVFTAVHVGGILLDSYVHFSAVAALVPFASQWRTSAVAWGVVGFYLLAAVEITSLARTRLPRRLWRATHFVSFPLFAFTTLHAVTAGTDAHTWLFELCATTAVLSVAALCAVRVAHEVSPPPAKPGRARSAPTSKNRLSA